MLILTIIIPTIIYVGKNIIQPIETAEIEKQEESDEEKISAASVRVEAGKSYTVPKDGIYKIELHGGKSADIELTDGTIILGNKGSKVTGNIRLNKGDVLNSVIMAGGEAPQIIDTSGLYGFGFLKGGRGVRLELGSDVLGAVSGGPGLTVAEVTHAEYGLLCAGGHLQVIQPQYIGYFGDRYDDVQRADPGSISGDVTTYLCQHADCSRRVIEFTSFFGGGGGSRRRGREWLLWFLGLGVKCVC